MAVDESAVGLEGRLIMPTRPDGGLGEVMIRIRGGSEAYLAWSVTPLPKGTRVLVVGRRGPRCVEVVEWALDPPALED